MKTRLCVLPLLFGSLLPAWSQIPSKPHVLMISVDGMRPDYATEAAKHQLHMTTLSKFISEGTYADGVTGIWPTVTFPSHTTLVTGVPPAEHGIVSNTTFDPLNQHPGVWFWYAKELKVEALWQAAKQVGLTTASVDWPVTVESPYIDYNVAAYATHASDGKKKTVPVSTPAGLLDELKSRLPRDRMDSDARRAEYAAAIIRRYQPNFMTVHLVRTDEAQHAHGPFSSEADEAMEEADGQIGKMTAAELSIDPNATIIVVSDHGFASTDTKVNLAALFVQKGLITLAAGEKGGKHPGINSWIATPWLSGGSAAIVLHDPDNQAEYDRVYNVLKEAEADPKLGILQIATRDQIAAHGGNPQASFFVDFKPGFRTGDDYKMGDLNNPTLTESAPGSGVHGYLPNLEPRMRSSFFVYGARIKKNNDLGIIDMRQIAPTIARLLGAVLPAAKMPPLPILRKAEPK